MDLLSSRARFTEFTPANHWMDSFFGLITMIPTDAIRNSKDRPCQVTSMRYVLPWGPGVLFKRWFKSSWVTVRASVSLSWWLMMLMVWRCLAPQFHCKCAPNEPETHCEIRWSKIQFLWLSWFHQLASGRFFAGSYAMTTFMGKLVVMPACPMVEAKPQAWWNQLLQNLPMISETTSVLGKSF